MASEMKIMKLTGAMIIRLMRKHQLTIRQIKVRFPLITLKRIREVRASGVEGFLAEEWFFIITGNWPDTSKEIPACL
jgi:hypothetical protein